MQQPGSWILFPSVTYASKARYYFGRAGINTRMERIPESVMGKTCGYRLFVVQDKLSRAIEICQSNQIRFNKIIEA